MFTVMKPKRKIPEAFISPFVYFKIENIHSTSMVMIVRFCGRRLAGEGAICEERASEGGKCGVTEIKFHGVVIAI